VRSASATRASGAIAGWQHVKTSRKRSSGIALSEVSGMSSLDSATWPSSTRIFSNRPVRRRASMARLRAVATSHARGLSGQPSSGQRVSAAVNASCTASSATWKSPIERMTVARTRPNSSR
jgi:hypothetical protein